MIVVRGIPLYWGVEHNALDRSLVTRAHMEEALPPYRYSTQAVRIRISHKHWLHIGLCRYKDTVTPWGLEVLPEHIGSWGRSVPPSTDTSEEPESLRQDAAGDGPASDRGVDAADGGTAARPDAQRDRPGLALVRDGHARHADAPGREFPEGPV